VEDSWKGKLINTGLGKGTMATYNLEVLLKGALSKS
jgi:hypothetical protein